MNLLSFQKLDFLQSIPGPVNYTDAITVPKVGILDFCSGIRCGTIGKYTKNTIHYFQYTSQNTDGRYNDHTI